MVSSRPLAILKDFDEGSIALKFWTQSSCTANKMVRGIKLLSDGMSMT